MKILAHRGFSAKYPENTRIAFRKALELPIDGLEFDVQLTCDEIPVVIHDATVKRTTDGDGPVSSMTLVTLRQLNAGNLKPQFGFQPIPTLGEVLDLAQGLYPNGVLNIELKVDEGDCKPLVDRVLSTVDGHPMRGQVLFSSFQHESLAYLVSRSSTFPVGLLFENNVAQPWTIAKEFGAYSVHLNYRFVNQELVRACAQHGIRTAVWTVDEPIAIERFMRWRTDMIITNVPDAALEVKQKVIG